MTRVMFKRFSRSLLMGSLVTAITAPADVSAQEEAPPQVLFANVNVT